ncbi:MAG: PspC domain-containing protein [Opitutales bacterium]
MLQNTNTFDTYGGLYRSRSGWIFGVCRGLEESRNISATALRIILVVLAFLTGFWPAILAYLLAAILMKPAPAVPFRGEEDREFYDSYTGSRAMALSRLKRTFDRLDRRIQRIEDVVTTREYDWDRRFRSEGKKESRG